MRSTKRSIILASLLGFFGLCFAGAMTACNTVEGAGRDVESAGRGVQQGSREVRN